MSDSPLLTVVAITAVAGAGRAGNARPAIHKLHAITSPR